MIILVIIEVNKFIWRNIFPSISSEKKHLKKTSENRGSHSVQQAFIPCLSDKMTQGAKEWSAAKVQSLAVRACYDVFIVLSLQNYQNRKSLLL